MLARKTIGAGGTMACSQGGGACAAHTKAANLATAATFAAATTARAATAAQGSNIGRIQSSSRRQGRQSPAAAQHGHRWLQQRMVVQQSKIEVKEEEGAIKEEKLEVDNNIEAVCCLRLGHMCFDRCEELQSRR